MISKETVFEVIKQCAAEKSARIPDGLEADFEEHLPEFDPLKTFNQVRTQLCRRVKKLLKDNGVLAEKYAEMYGQISQSVRLKLISLLGFQNYAAQPVYNGKSSRQLLKEFLQTLDEGESWNIIKLSEWEINGDNVGDKLRTRIAAVAGQWNIELVRLILGEEAEELLTRNPLEKLEWRVRTKHDARRYLRMYLSTLPDGASWSYTTLYEWTPPDGTDCASVIVQIKDKTGRRGFTEDAVRTVLGEEADGLLKKNPFTKRILRLTDEAKAKAALLDFMGSLEEGESWSSYIKLGLWTGEDGIRGSDLYKWIDRHFGYFDESAVRTLLGEDAEAALQRNPFTKPKQNIEPLAATVALKTFLLGMEEGRAWSASDLQSCVQIGDDGVKGGSLYCYILNAYGEFDVSSLTCVLGKEAEILLARNPFEIRHVEIVVSVNVVIEYLKKFLDLLPEGRSWSPTDLQSYGKIDDDVYGYSVYGWIQRNITHDGEVDWMYVLVKLIPSEYLRKHPFRHKTLGSFDVKDKKDYPAKSATTGRREIRETRTMVANTADDFSPDPEELFAAKESTERMMRREEFMREIYKYLEPHECELLNRFYAKEDIGNDQLLFLMGRVREIFLEHKPDLI